MAKAIVEVGYSSYVMDVEDALKLLDILGAAELFKSVWHSGVDGRPGTDTYHIYEQDDTGTKMINLRILSKVVYTMARTAGKPEEE